jgi:hypothetical protein
VTSVQEDGLGATVDSAEASSHAGARLLIMARVLTTATAATATSGRMVSCQNAAWRQPNADTSEAKA